MRKIIKLFFSSTFTYFKALQFLLILFALLTMIDFILTTIGIKLPTFIQCVFDAIYNFQSNFYSPKQSLIPVDFTLVTAATEMLILAGIIVYIHSFIIDFENTYDKVQEYDKNKYEQKFNQNLKKQAKIVENKTKQFVLLFNIIIESNTKNNIYMEEKPINIEEKIFEYNNALKNLLVEQSAFSIEKTSSGILAFFNDIEQSDFIFDKIFEFETKIKDNLKSKNLKFKLLTAVCIANKQTPKIEYLKKLEKLITISTPNKIMSLADFKTGYQNLKTQKYLVYDLGLYNMGEDTIDVFSIEPKKL